MTTGMIGGKFLPLHNGHIYAIEQAAKQVEMLYVVLTSSAKRDKELCFECNCKYMDEKVRLSWLGESLKHLHNVKIILIKDNCGNADYDWKEGGDRIRQAIPTPITHVFSSEPRYTKYFKVNFPDAKHVVIDKNRKTIPISATKIRKKTFKYWNYIPQCVREFFVKKILITGTESCGKSTLTQNLAKEFNTNFVLEIGREYSYEKGNFLTANLFDEIGILHYAEQLKNIKHSNKLIFVDTDAIVTMYYKEMYGFNVYSPILDSIARTQDYDLILFLEPDVPWVDDGIRFLGNKQDRIILDNYLKNIYKFYGQNAKIYVISGENYNERTKEAIKIVYSILKN